MSLEEAAESEIEAVDASEEIDDIDQGEDDTLQDGVADDPYFDEAVKFGWTPPEKWKGDGSPMSAEQFMERGPGTSRKLKSELEEVKKQLQRTTASTEATNRALKAAHDAKVQEEVERIISEQRNAVEAGDTQRFDELEQKRRKAEKEAAPKADDGAPSPEDAQKVQSWISSNADFDADPVFKAAANALFDAEQKKGVTDVDAILAAVDEGLTARGLKEGPKPAPRVRRQAAVHGDVSGAARRQTNAKSWNSIPADDRKAAQSFIKDGTFDALAKQLGVTPQEAYATKYWSE